MNRLTPAARIVSICSSKMIPDVHKFIGRIRPWAEGWQESEVGVGRGSSHKCHYANWNEENRLVWGAFSERNG